MSLLQIPNCLKTFFAIDNIILLQLKGLTVVVYKKIQSYNKMPQPETSPTLTWNDYDSNGKTGL